MLSSGIIQYCRDGTPVIILDKANACLAEGVKLMESTKEKLRAKMGGSSAEGRSSQGASATTASGVPVAITIDEETIKSTSLPFS